MDTVDRKTRSKIMSRVGQKNTGPENRLRKSLHRIGLRYRLHCKKLPGSPDIVFPRFKAVLFVHGCFWHRHGCKATSTPLSNEDFWLKKFDDNTSRDRRNFQKLLEKGWRVAIVWACALKNSEQSSNVIALNVRKWLQSDIPSFVLPQDKLFKGNSEGKTRVRS